MGEKRGKVLFLIQGKDVAASRYRVLQYLPYLRRDGIEAVVADFARKISQWPQLMERLGGDKVLFIQRKQLGAIEYRVLKKLSKKIVYDFDDALWSRSAKHRSRDSFSRRFKFRRMVKLADEVITCNTFLEEKTRRINSHVTVIPTPIDLSKYNVRSFAPGDGVVVGWVGAHGSIHYLERLIPLLEKVHSMNPRIRLKVICDVFPESERLPIDKIRWNIDTEADELKTLDIGLMPLTDDEWSWGKCGLKILQYSAVGVPAIVTPVGINRDIVRDGINGFWARTEKEWIDRVLLLAANPALRREMGLKARETVEERYSVEACYPMFKRVLFD